MLIDFVADFDHGILVVEQLGSTALHEDWDVYALAAHRQDDSLYVAVLPPMEGQVAVSVREASGNPSGTEPPLLSVFEGRVLVPSGVLLIGDSDRNIEVRLPVTSGSVGVSVRVDEPGLASQVVVLLDRG